ncbi:MAG: threonine/serine dehydratase [Anaerolineae bacterium]|nr:threonine/serine dehydratase [Anaerolineae bacterium]
MEELPNAPSLPQILEARRILRRALPPTPLRTFPRLNRWIRGEIWLKLEAWQPTGSFKVRGALARVAHLTPAERARGVVTASAGNHGLAVAFVARMGGGIPTTVFVPETAAQNKIRALESLEVPLKRVGWSYEEAHAAALAFAASTGACYIHAYEDPWVVAGQGTIALEILEELPQADAVLVPVGGGGLISGIALVYQALAPQTRIIGVQTEASPALAASLRDGRLYADYPAGPTLADGLAGGVGALAYQLARQGAIHEVVVVREETVLRAIGLLAVEAHLIGEGSGAVGLAALLEDPERWVGKRVVLILSGGNLDGEILKRAVEVFLAEGSV